MKKLLALLVSKLISYWAFFFMAVLSADAPLSLVPGCFPDSVSCRGPARHYG